MSNTSLPARYAHAITTYLHGDLRSAVRPDRRPDRAAARQPLFQEVRGQALLEAAKPAEAIAPLRKAVQLSITRRSSRCYLGQALVASNSTANTDEAIAILRAAVAGEVRSTARLHAARNGLWPQGDYAQADLASAQAAFLRGDNKTARDLASRAKTRFAIGRRDGSRLTTL